MKLDKGRDLRKKGWFWLDNDYLNGYAKHLGTTASCVYISLCRHTDKDQTCFPKIEKIGEELGISKPTVIRAIKELEKWKIIEVTREYDSDKKRQKSNIYLLLDKEHWAQKPSNKTIPGVEGGNNEKPSNKNDQSRVTQLYCKETHIKETHIKTAETSSALIPEVIKMFEAINPTCRTYYGHKSQRAACEFLIDTYGFERVRLVIEKTLPHSNGLEFFPNITTPIQLKEKWTSLENAIKSYRIKKQLEKNKRGKVAFS